MAAKLPPVNDPVIKPWAREIEKLLLGTKKNVESVARNVSAQGSRLAGVDSTLAPLQQAVQIPRAPQNVMVSSDWAWTQAGELSVILTVAWDAVTLDLNDGPVKTPSYEVWLATESTPSRRVNSTENTSLDIQALASGINYRIKVRAVTGNGATGEFSAEVDVLHPTADELAPVGAPSMPVVDSSNGAVSVAWDGELADTEELPPYFDYVYIGMSDTENGTYVAIGQQLRRAGGVVVANQPIGSTRWFKLFAVDRIGRLSDGSEAASIVVEGVDLGDLGDELEQLELELAAAQSDIDLALTGDIDGARLIAGSILAPKIGAGQILATHIGAGEITALHIAADAIEANNIKAGAIEVSHLSPAVGESIDISANSSVNFLIGSISTNADEINNLSNNLEEMGTYYQFGVDGAEISSPNSPFSVAVRNDRIEMLEQGMSVSYWNAGQLFVRSFVGEEVILGNHKMEKYGNGTVVRIL